MNPKLASGPVMADRPGSMLARVTSHYARRQDEDHELLARRCDPEQPQGLASRRHKGNVSALLAEIASREAKFAAAEAYFEKYGVPLLDDEAVERIEAERRGAEPPKKTRRRAA